MLDQPQRQALTLAWKAGDDIAGEQQERRAQ